MSIKHVKQMICLVFLASFFFSSHAVTPKKSVQTQSRANKKQVRVYVDMICDLFHAGHINFLRQARQFGDYLIVGLCNDEDTTSYKRKPIWTLEERVTVVQACKYVDEVIPNAPLAVTDEYLEKHNIDVVAHGSDFDEAAIQKYYGAVLDRPQTVLKIVPYTQGISTSETIRRILTRANELAQDVFK